MLFRNFTNQSYTNRHISDIFREQFTLEPRHSDFDVDPDRIISINQRRFADNPQLKPKKRIKIPILGRFEVPKTPGDFDDDELSAALELSRKTEKRERELRERAEKEKESEREDLEKDLSLRKKAFRDQLLRDSSFAQENTFFQSEEWEKLASETFLEWKEETLLKKKIKAFGFTQINIEGDGNCQFRALADQLFEDSQRHAEIRKEICSWLRKNEEFKIGTATLKEFCPSSQGWDFYCQEMEKDKTWGDHITLFAAAQRWKVQIFVLSSFVSKNETEFEAIPDITISPDLQNAEEIESFIYLVHWHERHYSSLRMKEE